MSLLFLLVLMLLVRLCVLFVFFFLFFSLYLEHPSLVGCSSCPHQDRPVVEKLSRSRGVGPQALEAQCSTYFGVGEEVRGVVNVCLAEWA